MTTLSRSVASVRHADAPVFQTIFGVELVTAGMVVYENPVNGGRWLDLRIPIRLLFDGENVVWPSMANPARPKAQSSSRKDGLPREMKSAARKIPVAAVAANSNSHCRRQVSDQTIGRQDKR